MTNENRLHLKRKRYHFQLKKGISIDELINNYAKFLADLANVDEVVKDKDKDKVLTY